MSTRRRVIALASILGLAGCSDAIPTDPAASGLKRIRAVADLAVLDSFDLPIEFPSGITYDGSLLYLSTLSGWRDTYKIDKGSKSVVGAPIPSGGNPRDVAYDGAGSLWYAHVDCSFSPNCPPAGIVKAHDMTGFWYFAYSLPFRGGALAIVGDTIFNGDLDTDSVRVTDKQGFIRYNFDSGLRLEGLVNDPASGNLLAITLFDSNIYEITKFGQMVRKCESPYYPGPYGLGGITLVGDTIYIAETQGGDPFAGTRILVLDRNALDCTPALGSLRSKH